MNKKKRGKYYICFSTKTTKIDIKNIEYKINKYRKNNN